MHISETLANVYISKVIGYYGWVSLFVFIFIDGETEMQIDSPTLMVIFGTIKTLFRVANETFGLFPNVRLYFVNIIDLLV